MRRRMLDAMLGNREKDLQRSVFSSAEILEMSLPRSWWPRRIHADHPQGAVQDTRAPRTGKDKHQPHLAAKPTV